MDNSYVNSPFKKQPPIFSIRKISRKQKNSQDNIFTPEMYHQKYIERINLSDKKQKETNLNCMQHNALIMNTKTYQQLKNQLQRIKKKNIEERLSMVSQINQVKKQKQQAIVQRQHLIKQKNKHLNIMNTMIQKLEGLKQTNLKYQELTQNKMTNQTQYLTNLIMSIRFQAQYEHNINPDQMTYEELLELEQKIGSVSRGLTNTQIAKLQQKVACGKLAQQLCTVCFCSYENGQIITKITCKHQFHYECLKLWFQKQKICPICKQEVDIK